MKDNHPLCDWCGGKAITSRYRTLYEETEYEQTSQYFECRRCSRLPTDKVVKVKPRLKYRLERIFKKRSIGA